jgi:hypothetical protein
MTLTVAEIIEEVRREAERKHQVPDDMAQNWPRFPLVKVVPLCDEVDRLTGDNAALSEALDTALLHLKESEAERDALAGQLAQALKDEIEYTFTRLGNPLIKTQPPAAKQEPFAEWSAKAAVLFEPPPDAGEEAERVKAERDALAAQLAKALDVSKMSVGQLQVIRDAATNRLYEVYCDTLERQEASR